MAARRATRLWAIEVAVKGTAGLSDRTDLSNRSTPHRTALESYARPRTGSVFEFNGDLKIREFSSLLSRGFW
jgi:hypothetical protein